MTTIKAIVRDGKIELDEPIDLPDGTELFIPLQGSAKTLGIRDEAWIDTPEAAEAWIRWYDSLEPLEFTPEERRKLEAIRRQDKEWELAQWENRSQRTEGLFP